MQFMVIPRHFIPPMVVNGVLGFVLWSTYSKVSDTLDPYLSSYPITLAAISGASAGGMQALIAAPAENVRLALEGTSSATARGWSHAWKEVFRGTQPQSSAPRLSQVHEARQVRDWMKDVGEMAGRGWDGWGWGCAKDICGEMDLEENTVISHANSHLNTSRFCSVFLHLRIDTSCRFQSQSCIARHLTVDPSRHHFRLFPKACAANCACYYPRRWWCCRGFGI